MCKLLMIIRSLKLCCLKKYKLWFRGKQKQNSLCLLLCFIWSVSSPSTCLQRNVWIINVGKQQVLVNHSGIDRSATNWFQPTILNVHFLLRYSSFQSVSGKFWMELKTIKGKVGNFNRRNFQYIFLDEVFRSSCRL